MEIENPVDAPDTTYASGSSNSIDESRRTFLRAAGLLVAGLVLPQSRADQRSLPTSTSEQKVILVVIGGVRRAESFSREGLENIPHLIQDLLPLSLFYTHARNDGVTAHFNAISSILTGNWQRVDDWGKLAPTTPTLFEQFRKASRAGRSDTWVVASNKALTSLIGASSATGFGPEYGANVVFPKQLMLTAVEEALRSGRTANMADRVKVEAELQNALEGSNFEGLGWNVFDAAAQLDPRVEGSIKTAIANFVRGGGPTSGDELTFFMTREVMRKFAPRVLTVAFSDVEAAHFGSYSLHVAGIRTADRLAYQLWQEVELNPDYRGKTTMVILPEFGRDPDGSSTNGFFNHRANEDSTRDTWMMALGAAIDKPQIIERPIRHIDVCPTLTQILDCRGIESQGARLPEFRA
ncbi:hypothetical protein P8935_00435 [Telmatobacter sp. DSM 110680]|uniref:DUF1501 domain-containing protein n=1 Tax=Telmatobacter sp. DSM 110680 TaxID=3036704 RepID=A0AAU7DKE0_9BACT